MRSSSEVCSKVFDQQGRLLQWKRKIPAPLALVHFRTHCTALHAFQQSPTLVSLRQPGTAR